jgi:hypothetical protein
MFVLPKLRVAGSGPVVHSTRRALLEETLLEPDFLAQHAPSSQNAVLHSQRS